MRPPFGPRTYTRRDALQLGLGALGAALLAACSDDDDAADATASTATPEATAVSLLDADPPPPSGESGILRQDLVGEPQPPPGLSYSRLVSVDPRDATLHGDLAERVEQVGPLELLIQLRADAFFHPVPDDGTARPLDAGSVARDFEVRADAGEYLFNDVVAVVEAPEANMLRLRLRGPFALLFEFLGDPSAASIRAQSPSPLGLPLGSGPFIPERSEGDAIVLRRHPLYHQPGLPLLDQVRLVSAEREQALDAAFESGALDVRTLTTADSLARASERSDASVLTRSTRRMRGLGLSLVGSKGGGNVRFHPAFQDDRVRRALFLALDRAELSERADGGAAPPVGPVGPAHGADALPAEELAEHPIYQHDPGEAMKLLDAAGQRPLTFTLEAPNRDPLADLARRIARQLRLAGFRPELALVSPEDWQRDLAAGDFQSILFELDPVRTPDVGLRLHTSGGLDGAFSPWGYSNPVYDEAVRAALSALDPAERAARSRAAQRTLLDAVPALLPLPEPLERIALASSIGGYAYESYEFNEAWLGARWHIRSNAS